MYHYLCNDKDVMIFSKPNANKKKEFGSTLTKIIIDTFTLSKTGKYGFEKFKNKSKTF